MAISNQKPTRVMTEEVHVANCPVCEAVLTGTMSVEVYVDGVDVQVTEDGPRVGAQTSSRVRGLDMPAHRCRPDQTVTRRTAPTGSLAS